MTKAQAKKLRYLNKLLRAIKLRCLDCSAYSVYEVKNCIMTDCSLYPYRRGVLNNSLKIQRKKPQTKQKTLSQEGDEVIQ